jgi:hypothetical protein
LTELADAVLAWPGATGLLEDAVRGKPGGLRCRSTGCWPDAVAPLEIGTRATRSRTSAPNIKRKTRGDFVTENLLWKGERAEPTLRIEADFTLHSDKTRMGNEERTPVMQRPVGAVSRKHVEPCRQLKRLCSKRANAREIYIIEWRQLIPGPLPALSYNQQLLTNKLRCC